MYIYIYIVHATCCIIYLAFMCNVQLFSSKWNRRVQIRASWLATVEDRCPKYQHSSPQPHNLHKHTETTLTISLLKICYIQQEHLGRTWCSDQHSTGSMWMTRCQRTIKQAACLARGGRHSAKDDLARADWSPSPPDYLLPDSVLEKVGLAGKSNKHCWYVFCHGSLSPCNAGS